MATVRVRFFGELNDFLAPPRRQAPSCYPVTGRTSIKDLIEALGVPHTEVDLILVCGESVPFDYRIEAGDRISVYPAFRSIDLVPCPRVGPGALDEPRFVLDTHLGKLASYLRMLGFDTLYRNDYDDATLASVSAEDQRILLTQDRGLLKRNEVVYGYYVRSADPRKQLREVALRFQLADAITPFQRCLRCNGQLSRVDKASIADRLEPRTRQYYDEFHLCTACNQIYWKGSHYERMRELIGQVLNEASVE